jgi:uncharacterized protein (DUF1778 family)
MTAATATKNQTRREVTINVRATLTARDLIDQAAKVVGTNRSAFILDSARLRAEDVLLDQRLFVLDDEAFKAFTRILDRPAKPTKALKKLLAAKAPWEK